MYWHITIYLVDFIKNHQSPKLLLFHITELDFIITEWTRLHGTTAVFTVIHITNDCSYLKVITMKDSVEINIKRNGKMDTYNRLHASLPPHQPINFVFITKRKN